MPFVAILGAGRLGGALTYTLANRARFDEIRLIDPVGTVAVGKALDIRQAGPADGFSTRVTGHAVLSAAAGAWVVVLADPLPAPDTTKAQTAPGELIRAVAGLAPAAVIVCADTSHGPLLRGIVGAGLVTPDLLVCSAPGATVATAQSLVSLTCGCAPTEVTVGVTSSAATGALALDWTRVTMRGRRADELLGAEQRDRLDRQLAAAWPPGPYALAAAAARAAEAAWFGSRRTFSMWVADRSLRPDPAGLADLVFDPGGRMRAAGAH